jgi:hypothetical protein
MPEHGKKGTVLLCGVWLLQNAAAALRVRARLQQQQQQQQQQRRSAAAHAVCSLFQTTTIVCLQAPHCHETYEFLLCECIEKSPVLAVGWTTREQKNLNKKDGLQKHVNKKE